LSEHLKKYLGTRHELETSRQGSSSWIPAGFLVVVPDLLYGEYFSYDPQFDREGWLKKHGEQFYSNSFKMSQDACWGSMSLVRLLMLNLGYLMFGDEVLPQITLNLPTNAFASKISLWIISKFSLILNKCALTMNPLARSLEELLPHRISSTTWCFMLLRTILVMVILLAAFLIPYF
ncbi:hypothetical protein S83_062827, partial [Arachis hypogaea]